MGLRVEVQVLGFTVSGFRLTNTRADHIACMYREHDDLVCAGKLVRRSKGALRHAQDLSSQPISFSPNKPT